MTVSTAEAEQRLQAALAAKADRIGDDAEIGADDLELPADVVRLSTVAGPGRSRRRHLTVLAAAAVAAVLAIAIGITVAGRDGSSSVQPTMKRSQVPWSQVDSSWTLVQEATQTADNGHGILISKAPEHLILVSPQRQRYDITTIGPRAWALVAWDAAAGRALLRNQIEDTSPTKVLQVDLHSGGQTQFTASDPFDLVSYTGPGDGSILLIDGKSMRKVGLTGQLETRFPPSTWYSQGVVDDTDGQHIIAGSSHGLVVLDAASGRTTATLAPPAGRPNCWAPRRQPNGDLTASCGRALAEDAPVDRYVFTDHGSLAPGRTDAQHPLGFLRVINFAAGTVAIRQSTSNFLSLTGAELVKIDPSGRQSPLSIPARLRGAGWIISSISGDAIILTHHGVRADDLVRWNPLTAVVQDVYRPDTPAGAIQLAVGGQDVAY